MGSIYIDTNGFNGEAAGMGTRAEGAPGSPPSINRKSVVR